jgi:tripeptidyl-peptidase II
MLFFSSPRRHVIGAMCVIASFFLPLLGHAQNEDFDWEKMRSALIPKREVGADTFITENPTYDGRDVVIAIFDTGVDPAAPDLQVTTTGERKIIDIIDGSGAGDVKLAAAVEPDADGTLPGQSGLTLTLPDDLTNPEGKFHLGLKPAREMFAGEVLARLQANVSEQWSAELSVMRHAEAAIENTELAAARGKAASDRTREEQNLIALADAKEALDDRYASSGPGIVYDCVVWQDGEHWRVIVDTNRNGDLSDDDVLRPFGVAGEYSRFDDFTNATFGVQVYEEGRLLSIVTTEGAHGTHVASIAAGHDPDDPARNGIAPGARIVSVQIGDARVGGSAYGIGERRALAAVSRLGVDMTNISFGGSSTYQDGSDLFSEVMNRMVRNYDILTLMSAGNDGPALSTAGSSGAEADYVLGVGAYASEEMGKALYTTIKDAPDASLQFTSRGPTKDGDVGVDIMAPGAAWASLSSESLTATAMFAGTSMASPSATGVAALVLSAAKQNGMAPRPALMRHALMLGAAPIAGEGVFTTGAGLVNAPGAWAKLQELVDHPEFDMFYRSQVTGGTFVDRGRGLYLRESLDELRRQESAQIAPLWTDSSSLPERAAFAADYVLRPADDWIEVADFFRLANGSERVRFIVNLPDRSATERTNGGVLTSRIDGLVAGAEELGAAFSVPITVVRPADNDVFVDHVHETQIALRPAVTARRFYEVPRGMQKLHITARHVAEDKISRGFMMQVVSVGAQVSYRAYSDESWAWLDADEEFSTVADVLPGSVVELAINQFFTTVGPATIELELEWLGVGVLPDPVVVHPNQDFEPIEFLPPRDLEVSVEAELTDAVVVKLPIETELFYSDERGKRAPTPMVLTEELDQDIRLTYELTFEEETAASLLYPVSHDRGEAYSGGRYRVLHESGEVLYQGYAGWRSDLTFPAGKTTVVTEFSTLFPLDLKTLKTMPLRVAIPLSSPSTLPLMAQEKDISRGRPTGDLTLTANRQEIVFLQNTALEVTKDMTPSPSYLDGELKFLIEDEQEIAVVALRHYAGEFPSEVTDQDPPSKPGDDLKTPTETLEDSIYDLHFDYIREHRLSTDPAIAPRRLALLAAIETERPDDPAPLIERAIEGAILAGLASDYWGSLPDDPETDEVTAETDEPQTEEFIKTVPSEEQVLTWLDEAQARADAEGVAKFFGAKPVALPGDLVQRDIIAAEEKAWAAKRDALATITRLRADVHRAGDRLDEAWAELAELARWEPEASEETTKMMAAMYTAAGFHGLALEKLNAQISEAPHDTDLLKQRIELYRELGWERHAEAEERLLAVRATNLTRIEVL